MSSLNRNTVTPAPRTAEGGIAARISPLQELIRLSMACMLWEDGFYIDGQTVANRITTLVHSVTLAQASGVAIEARNKMKLRHVPLLICRAMASHPKRTGKDASFKGAVGDGNHTSWISLTLAEVIQRPDELTEFLAIYWKDGKCPLSKQVKLGLAKAFSKFNEYQLAKYNRAKDITLKDVLFLCHSKPQDVPASAEKWDKVARATYGATLDSSEVRPNGFTEGELLYGKLIYDQLETPDTWEVELSQSKDKKSSWLRLISENKLGDLAFLRNLRNMLEAGIIPAAIAESGDTRKWGRVLPFRFIAAARMVPVLEPMLERWMLSCLANAEKLPGITRLYVDVSRSMQEKLSSKSDLTRLDAAKALAILLREICQEVYIYTFNTQASIIPARSGFALADAIGSPRGGTSVGSMYSSTNHSVGHSEIERDIIITDEQSRDRICNPIAKRGYFINVGSNKNGIGYGPWLHVDGFSESVVDYIRQYEQSL